MREDKNLVRNRLPLQRVVADPGSMPVSGSTPPRKPMGAGLTRASPAALSGGDKPAVEGEVHGV